MNDIYENLEVLEPQLLEAKKHLNEQAATSPQVDLVAVKNAVRAINKMIYAIDDLKSELFIFQIKQDHLDLIEKIKAKHTDVR